MLALLTFFNYKICHRKGLDRINWHRFDFDEVEANLVIMKDEIEVSNSGDVIDIEPKFETGIGKGL